jgi:fucose permease
MDGGQAIGIVASLSAGIVGLLATTAGHLKKSLSKELDLGDPQINGLWWALCITMLPMLPAWGLAIDDYHVKSVMILGSFLSSIGLFGLTWRRSYAYALVFVCFGGLGVGALGVSSLTLLSDPSWAKPAASLSIGLFFLTLGMLAGPRIVQPLMNKLGFKRTLCLLALVCLTPAALIALLTIPMANKPNEEMQIFSSATYWMIAILVFAYPAFETTVGKWTTPYFQQQGFSERKAFAWLTIFWAAFLVSRLGMTAIFERYPEGRVDSPWFLFTITLALAILFGNLAGSAHATRASLGLILLGGFLGPLLPVLIALLFRHAVGVSGMAIGTVAAGGFLGVLVWPPVINSYSRARSPQHAWRVLAILTLIMVCLVLVIVLTNSHVYQK